MERCLWIKILITAAAGGAVGLGGYYAKQGTGAVIGAGVGGAIGWLLAPGCPVEDAVLPPAEEQPPVEVLPPAEPAPERRVRLPRLRRTASRTTTECPSQQVWSNTQNKCVWDIR
jgi:hypothetical protein